MIEARRPLGTDDPPLQAGIRAGSVVPTAATWGEFDLGFTQFYLRHNLFDNRDQYAIGKPFAPNFVNAFPFFDDNRQFFNQNFSTSPTIPTRLRGFGAVSAVYPTQSGFYTQAGVFTAKSEDTGFTIDSVLDESEFFYSLEVGWSGLASAGVPLQARGSMDTDNIHLNFWFKDSQKNASAPFQPQAEGVAFNANFKYGTDLMWFLRGGVSYGWVTERAFSGGFGYRPPNATAVLFGLGVAWSQPANDVLREQYTV